MKKFVSVASINFEEASWDIYHLFDVHDDLMVNESVLLKNEKADVLVRSTYLFITACWESYIEDLCEEAFSNLLRHSIIGKKWIGNVHKKHSKDLIQNFNTPKSNNINNLYSAIIGLTNLSNCWKWSDMNAMQAQSKLGMYIKIRGAISHRTRTSVQVSRIKAEEYLDFVKILVSKTENRVQSYVKRITGSNFGKKL